MLLFRQGNIKCGPTEEVLMSIIKPKWKSFDFDDCHNLLRSKLTSIFPLRTVSSFHLSNKFSKKYVISWSVSTIVKLRAIFFWKYRWELHKLLFHTVMIVVMSSQLNPWMVCSGRWDFPLSCSCLSRGTLLLAENYRLFYKFKLWVHRGTPFRDCVDKPPTDPRWFGLVAWYAVVSY